MITPLISEKSLLRAKGKQYSFIVSNSDTKAQIAKIISRIFKVAVKKVNILNRRGKAVKVKGRVGARKDYRIAVVKIQPNQTIAGFSFEEKDVKKEEK